MSASEIGTIALRDGASLPQVGFGVFLIPAAETAAAVGAALEAGYRAVDTASGYRNEPEVGEAVRASGRPRAEVFVTTKCFNTDHGYEEAKRACHESLERLDIGPIDLYLIHWPVPANDRYVDTWRAFIELRDEGVVRSIGVSNFQPAHLERLIAETGETPVINQVELHPRFPQVELRRVHAELGIVTAAWSPLARGALLDDPVIATIAAEHGRSPAQVVLRWHRQLGNAVVVKSVTPSRIRENLDVLGFELSDEQVEAISALDNETRIGPDPETFYLPPQPH
jgi:2,5-diketo-D-gluconate reductase A